MSDQIFEGLKVADFCWVGVGPITMSYLAVHGALVIHIEYSGRPEILRTTPPYKDNIAGVNRSAYFANFNPNKYGISLNLNHPRGREIARRICAWADVIGESFTPGTMKEWGLAYEDLAKIKPDLIMFSTCQQGQTGPHAGQPGFGAQLVSLSGFTHVTGWPDRPPTGPYGPYTDVIAPLIGTAALVAALDYRRQTGKGQHIDLSQFEAGVHFMAPLFMACGSGQEIEINYGNRNGCAVPHGAYPCSGQDRWCAIGVFNDDEWQALCRTMGDPAWTNEERFATFRNRKNNEDELDRLISAWTVNFPADALMYRLQSSGVAAGVVGTCEDLHRDIQLKHRGFFRGLEHPEIGYHHYDGPAFNLSGTPGEITMPAPCMGQHNEYVYTKILGLSDNEFIELIEQGVI